MTGLENFSIRFFFDPGNGRNETLSVEENIGRKRFLKSLRHSDQFSYFVYGFGLISSLVAVILVQNKIPSNHCRICEPATSSSGYFLFKNS